MQTLNNWAINGSFQSTVSGLGITAKYFPAPSANFTAGAGSTPNAGNAAGQLLVPGENKLNGQVFRIFASGNILTAGSPSPSILIELCVNTGTVTSPSYTVIANSGTDTQAGADATFPWYIDVTASGDTGSGILQGRYSSVWDNVVEHSNIALDNTVTGLVFGPSATATQDQRHSESGANAVCGLVVRVTFGTTNAGNTANMFRFAIES
jgi:hypothetical protein